MYDGAPPLVAVPLVRELRRVALRDAQAALGEVELIGGLPEDVQHEGLEAGHLHALGQLPDERERLELHERRAADLLEQRHRERRRAVRVREQLLPQLLVARALHELDRTRLEAGGGGVVAEQEEGVVVMVEARAGMVPAALAAMDIS